MRTVAIAFVAFAVSTTIAAADPCEGPQLTKGTWFHGVASYIVDGDGLCIGTPVSEAIEIRLADFRAMELRDPGGREAKAKLKSIAFGKRLNCYAADNPSWDRTVAICTLNGKRLGDLMRAAGVPEGGR